MRARPLTALVPLAGLVLGLLLPAAPASAAARVTVTNDFGTQKVDPTYTTRLTVKGSGFRSIRNGFGGIYVVFGTVSGNWRPSADGDGTRLYVPDSQTKANAGYQRFVAFPGTETAESANGGTLGADGSWSVTINVPGATFKTVDANNRVRTVDCRKVRCGVITFGAHGVDNRVNETFTPVTVADLHRGSSAKSSSQAAGTSQQAAAATDEAGTSAATAPGTATAGTATAGTEKAGTAKAAAGAAKLEVDRASAGAGKILAFTAAGIRPGAQVSAVLDDGDAGAGPFTVGATGQVAGLLQVPADTAPGTHELRLVGVDGAPSVRFAVASDPAAAESTDEQGSWWARAFVLVAALVLVAAVLLAVRRVRRRHVAA